VSEDRTQQLPDDGVRLILARLTALEDKVDRRLQETRPIWEQVLARLTNVEGELANVKEELVNVKEGLTKVEIRLGKVEDEVDSLGRKFRVFNRDILKLQNQDDDLTERMDRIEAEHTR
jgi:chromosome segregation ATPase